ncbi:hypothetical protein E4T66_11625 [Sinimarinibacterium sp. CAU 1509]|uniref:hypothetical protein n=1 Tax=Sinimarinibacterium sp. CAU 1509 TaxID=2562283 RepID=UPI0010ACCAB4|nr:hypothetical protein [Sinimarinibacterium sp. CAU 1509]TJY59828.1 hypothetical protein E4T66_11625 [Sinimarinibacterium sp. CAU 1509]
MSASLDPWYRRVSRWLPFYHLEDRLHGVLVCSISLPLIALSGFLIFSPSDWGFGALGATVLAGTLIALGGAMWLVSKLMAPIRLAQSALRIQRHQLGSAYLPIDLDGDAGAMLADLRTLIDTCERQRRQLETLHEQNEADRPKVRAPAQLRVVAGVDA